MRLSTNLKASILTLLQLGDKRLKIDGMSHLFNSQSISHSVSQFIVIGGYRFDYKRKTSVTDSNA